MKRVVPEAAPWIVTLLRRSSDSGARSRYYAALILLLSKDVGPLARADLKDAPTAQMQSAAAGILITIGDEEGMELIGGRLRDGDLLMLDVLFSRCSQMNEEGLPEALVPAVLGALRSLAGEEARRKALYCLRARGEARRGHQSGPDPGLSQRTQPPRRAPDWDGPERTGPPLSGWVIGLLPSVHARIYVDFPKHRG